MSNGVTQFAKVSSVPPPGDWPRVCRLPLPENTQLIASVIVGAGQEVDHYFRQKRQPGAKAGGLQWVCRMKIGTGKPVDKTEATRPKEFEAQPEFSQAFAFSGDFGMFLRRTVILVVAVLGVILFLDIWLRR